MLKSAITTHVMNNRLAHGDHRESFLTCLLPIFFTTKLSVSTINKHNRVDMLCFTTWVNHSKKIDKSDSYSAYCR